MVENDKKNIYETIKELMEINKIPKILLKDIKLKKKIGEGGQAKVYRGTLNKEEVAVKVLEEVDWKCLAHEIVIISNLHHDCIPKFYGIILEDSLIGLVNKYISGKPLDEYKLSEFNEKQKIKIIKSLASALDYIHDNKFIHRDLKPENIMIDSNLNFFLIDFGIAKVMTNADDTVTRAKGTLHYLAPETLDVAELTDSEEIVSYINTKVDVWAFGCITSYIFSEKLPWCNRYQDNPAVIQKVLCSKNKEFPIPDNIANDTIKEIIKLCTVRDQSKRASMKQIKALTDKLSS